MIIGDVYFNKAGGVESFRPVAYQEVAVTAAVTKLPAIESAWKVVGYLAEGAMSCTVVTGTPPTDTFGVPLYSGDRGRMSTHEAERFQAIRVGGTNGILRLTYYN